MAAKKRRGKKLAVARAAVKASPAAGYRVEVVARRDGGIWSAVVRLGVPQLAGLVAALVRAAK